MFYKTHSVQLQRYRKLKVLFCRNYAGTLKSAVEINDSLQQVKMLLQLCTIWSGGIFVLQDFPPGLFWGVFGGLVFCLWWVFFLSS